MRVVDKQRAMKRKRNKRDYSALRLCNQVAQTLNLVLSGEFGDERLQSLYVMSVEPAPNASQLCVVVQTDVPTDRQQRREILALLESVSGRLRYEMANAINRKKTPQLIFRVISPKEIG